MVTSSSPSNGSSGVWPDHDPSIKSGSQDGGLRRRRVRWLVSCNSLANNNIWQLWQKLNVTMAHTVSEALFLTAQCSFLQCWYGYEFWDLEFFEGVIYEGILAENESLAGPSLCRIVKNKHYQDKHEQVSDDNTCEVSSRCNSTLSYCSGTASPVLPPNHCRSFNTEQIMKKGCQLTCECTHPCADSFDLWVPALFRHFSLQNRKRGRRGDAPNSDLRRTETRREKTQRDPVWRYQMSSKLLPLGLISTTQRGMSSFMSSEQQTIWLRTEHWIKLLVTLRFHRHQKWK